MNLYKQRFLILELVRIEFTQNYKKSFFGLFWIIFLPIMQSMVWVFMQYNGLIDPGKIAVNYTAYVLISTLLWQLYNQSYDILGVSISSSIKPLTQGHVPILTIIISKYILILCRFILSLLVNSAIIYFLVETPINIFSFLLCSIPLAIFCVAIGMLFSMIEVVNQDLYILGKEFNKILLFLTPIIYSPNVSNWLIQKIIYYNPLNYLISLPRDLYFNLPIQTNLTPFYIVSATSIVLFLFILYLFQKRVRLLVEKIIE